MYNGRMIWFVIVSGLFRRRKHPDKNVAMVAKTGRLHRLSGAKKRRCLLGCALTKRWEHHLTLQLGNDRRTLDINILES